jgi:phage terminase large subunit-like protein
VESVIEAAILSLKARFALVACLFDPWQAVHLGQRLARAGVNMVEFNQHLSNLSMMAANLLDLLKTGRMRLYPDAELRAAAAKTIAIENSRGGWRLGKAKQSDRVDPIVSLAMAALACERAGSRALTEADRATMSTAQNYFHAQAERRRSMTLPSFAPPADSRLDGRGEDWANYEDSLQGGRRGRRRWGGF